VGSLRDHGSTDRRRNHENGRLDLLVVDHHLPVVQALHERLRHSAELRAHARAATYIRSSDARVRTRARSPRAHPRQLSDSGFGPPSAYARRRQLL